MLKPLLILCLLFPLASGAKPRSIDDVTQAAQPATLQSYEARYNVKFHGINLGEAVHKLTQKPDGTYHFQSDTTPSLSFIPYRFVESSDFTWENGAIKPKRYFYDYHEGKRKKRGFVRFDWKNDTVENTVGKNPWHATIQSNMQDKLSYTFMLRHDLYKGQYDLSYLVAEDDEVKPYQFRILGTETLKTALGTFKTIKVEHMHPKHRTTFWLAKDLDYLLVKIKQTRKGKQVGSAEITEYQKL